MQSLVTQSAEETRKLGKEIAQKAKGGKTIVLYGDLGSGKTTFVQGFAEGLGIKRRISSPTFIIMRSYEMQNSQLTRQHFYHLDLYRVMSEKDLDGIGLVEILRDPSNIVMIEWPERMGSLLPKNAMKIEFSYVSDEERKIVLYDN